MKWSPLETICLKCHILFLVNFEKKYISDLSSAEIVQRVVMVNISESAKIIAYVTYNYLLHCIWKSRAPRIYFITKTCLYNFDPHKPHFYVVKLGFTGVNIIFLISDQNIDCEYSLEPPRRGGSNEYPQFMFWAEIWKILGFYKMKIFHFLVVKFSVYLNRHFFVMY